MNCSAFARLGVNFVERRNAVVPFEQRGRRANAPDRVLVQFPHRIDHRMIVRIENIFLELGVAGDVNLRHALRRHAVQIIVRIEVMILRRNIDIIDVQQNAAVGPLHHFVQKLPLGHFRNVKFGVAADVLHRDGNFQEIARFANFCAP